MTSSEHQILLAASDISPGAGQWGKLRELMSREFDAQRLIELAIREGLVGLLYKSLLKSGSLESLDPARGQKLQSLYYLNVRNNLKLLHDFKEILQKLDQNDIRVVPLQGIVLLQQVYQDIGLRPLTDIDLWVLPGERQKLAQTLLGLNYEIDPAYPNTFRKGSTIVDVNTHILWAERIRTRRLLLDRDQKDIYDNCRFIDFEGIRTLSLNRHDQVLYLSLHVLKHYADRLIWLVDIRGLIADWTPSDWEMLMKRARVLGQEKAVACILFLLTDLFDNPLPPEAQAALEKIGLNPLERMLLKKRSNGHALPAWSPLLLFTAGKGLYRRVVFGFETLFPRPRILRQVFSNYPDLKTWQLYWKRVLQLLGWRFKAV